MPERTPAIALKRYVEPIDLALSCVTANVLQHEGRNPVPDVEYWATVARGGLVPVRTSHRARRLMRLFLRFRVEQVESPSSRAFVCVTTGYSFSLRHPDEREILAYHWHGDQHVIPEPHLHIPAGAGERILPEVRAAHLPTGHVSLQSFLWLLIRDFGVLPLRTDHERVLAEPAGGS